MKVRFEADGGGMVEAAAGERRKAARLALNHQRSPALLFYNKRLPFPYSEAVTGNCRPHPPFQNMKLTASPFFLFNLPAAPLS